MMVTTNDSGHAPAALRGEWRERQDRRGHRLPGQGGGRRGARTAGGTAVWVGDIGDNRASGSSSASTGSAWGSGDAHGPRRRRTAWSTRSGAATTPSRSFADRRGRLYVVTKSFLGGTVYRAPLAPEPHHGPTGCSRSAASASSPPTPRCCPTGGTCWCAGYDGAGVYTFPPLQRLGDFALPRQRQGEGISVGPAGRIRLSSEGRTRRCGEVALPAALAAARAARVGRRRPVPVAQPVAVADPDGRRVAPRPTPRVPLQASPVSSSGPGRRSWLIWSIPGVIVLGAVGIGLGLRRRSE